MVGLVRPLCLHFRYPVFLGLCVPPFHLSALLLRQGIVALHPIRHFFFFEGLIFPIGFHACHTFMVASTVEGFHFLDPIHGRILSLSIPFLLKLVFFGVPLFSVRCGRIHNSTLANGKNTRPQTLVTFGTDFRFSVEPGHVGPAVVAQSVRGSDDSSLGSASVCRPRFSFGSADRPVG